MKQKKTKDFDVRAALVRRLLQSGVPRGDIRHEITLDTNSSDGRADLVVLQDKRIAGVEIKSGSDNLNLLDSQLAAYQSAFDAVMVVSDMRHLDGVLDKLSDSRCGFFCPERQDFFSVYRYNVARDGEVVDRVYKENQFCPSDSIFYRVGWRGYSWDRISSSRTAPCAMARLLWRDELVKIAGCATRSAALDRASEHMSLAQLRPGVVAALRGRVLSRWEEAFWTKYDAMEAAHAHQVA